MRLLSEWCQSRQLYSVISKLILNESINCRLANITGVTLVVAKSTDIL